ncbi:MAG: hypothetical protein D8B38_06140 [Candidatus Saccharimonas sp.]|nr:MAG: hypothetical protein D8B38_06140 [Candidatus Saccharimonas sp.]
MIMLSSIFLSIVFVVFRRLEIDKLTIHYHIYPAHILVGCAWLIGNARFIQHPHKEHFIANARYCRIQHIFSILLVLSMLIAWVHYF